jgi:CPA1 family monovalent cation:H+ antiporter
MPEIVAGLAQEGISLWEALGYGLLVTAVLIIGRMLVAYGAVIFTMAASHFITVADKNPGWRGPLLLGWTGMRGVVSLAAALSIPVSLDDGTPFPQRNLILFITFTVILVTLVLQGLTLPYLIKKIKLPDFKDHLPEEETEMLMREEMAKTALSYITENYSAQLQTNTALQQFAARWQSHLDLKGQVKLPEEMRSIYREVLECQRQWILKRNRSEPQFDEDVLRKLLHHIDVEEEKLRIS